MNLIAVHVIVSNDVIDKNGVMLPKIIPANMTWHSSGVVDFTAGVSRYLMKTTDVKMTKVMLIEENPTDIRFSTLCHLNFLTGIGIQTEIYALIN